MYTLIFDWDGTLHNTKHLYGCAFRIAYRWLVSQSYAPEKTYTDEEVSIYLGLNARDMWNTFMPSLPQHVKETASDLVGREMVAAVLAGKAVLYPGAAKTLTRLKQQGFCLVFLSNCKHAYMEAHRKYFHLDHWFDAFYCCQDYDFAPKELIFPQIREAFPGDFIVIGDRSSDFAVARSHGLLSIGCAYGFGTPEEWGSADVTAWDVRQIPEKILQLCRNHNHRQ